MFVIRFDNIYFICYNQKLKKNGKCHWFDKIDIGNEPNSIKDKKENIVTLKSERQTFQFISFLFFFFDHFIIIFNHNIDGHPHQRSVHYFFLIGQINRIFSLFHCNLHLHHASSFESYDVLEERKISQKVKKERRLECRISSSSSSSKYDHHLFLCYITYDDDDDDDVVFFFLSIFRVLFFWENTSVPFKLLHKCGIHIIHIKACIVV